jgi:curved DNA-binding protein CbpA
MRKKIDFYAILGIPRSSSETEIEAAYDHLMQQLESDGHGLDAKQLSHRINLLNQAYWALSDRGRRTSYDFSLDRPDTPLQFSVEIQEPRWTSPKAILNIVGRLLVMGLLIQVGFMLVNFYMASQANKAQAPSEQDHILNGYDAINGKLSPEERAAGVTLADKQRQEAEADQIRREQEDARRRQEWELEKDRRYADEVSSNLREAEEQIRYRAEEERRRQAELEREKQEQERDRMERLREKWRTGSTNNTQADND